MIFGKERNKPAGLFKVLFLLLFITGASHLANAQEFTVDNLKFKIISTKKIVSLIGYQEKPTGDFIIPETVEYENETYSIKKIESNTFAGCTDLITVTIPKSVKLINPFVFSDCTSLISINVDQNNTTFSSIDGVLLKYKETLIVYPPGKPNTEYTIPNSVREIEIGAFESCQNLITVTIPKTVKKIRPFIFSNCLKLTSINVEQDNTKYSSLDGVLCDKDKNLLVSYPAGKVQTEYTIPNSVTIIGSDAFDSATGLNLVTIPSLVQTIETNAFYGCTGLTSIIIPNSVKEIGYGTFSGCTGLTSITSKIEDISKVVMQDEVFVGVNKETCTLHVPKGKVDDYKKADQWKDFKNIVEDATSAVSFTKANNVAIYPTVSKTGFTVEHAKLKTTLDIYTIAGKKVLSKVITSNKQFVDINNLQSGIYIVKVGGTTTKIVKI